MNGLRIRRVVGHETEATFDVLKKVAVWLEQKGRRQRIAKTTFDTYMMWQEDDANYVVLDRVEIVGVFSLPRERLNDWPMADIEEPVVWLRALATDPAHQKKGVGAFAVKEALKLVASPEPLYLDCVSDFLPGYYESLGFETIASQARRYAGEDQPFDITLLRHPNASPSSV
jgi:GNAT superfamily N-acetyltransferase